MPEVYIARKRLKVGASMRERGSAIPEAAGWRNLHSYLASGAVICVQTDVAYRPPMKQDIPLAPKTFPWQQRQYSRRRGALVGWYKHGRPSGGGIMMVRVELADAPDPGGQSVQATAQITGADGDTANIDWGDGSTVEQVPVQGGSATGEHTYTESGEFTISVTSESEHDTDAVTVPEPDTPPDNTGEVSLTFPTTMSVEKNTPIEFETELANSGSTDYADCTGRWTIASAGFAASDIMVNMVDFNGPGADLMIDFTESDGDVVGTYGPFPVAAGMSGATTDQILMETTATDGDYTVTSEILDSGGAVLASAQWTLSVTTPA